MPAPCDTASEEPRYRVSILEGYPIHPSGRSGGNTRPVADVHVWDHDHTPPTLVGFFRSSDYQEETGVRNPDGTFHTPPSRLGREGAIRRAEELCAELNAGALREAGQL